MPLSALSPTGKLNVYPRLSLLVFYIVNSTFCRIPVRKATDARGGLAQHFVNKEYAALRNQMVLVCLGNGGPVDFDLLCVESTTQQN
jgi:hypothetical protein